MSRMVRLISLLAIVALLMSCSPATTATPTSPQDQPTSAPVEPSTEEAPATPEQDQAQEPVTLSFMRPGVGDDALKEVEAEMAPFYEKYPWIQLDTLIVASDTLSQKIQTAVAGGEPPDIALLDAGSALKYIDSGLLLDLTPYAEKDGFDWQNYFNQEGLDFFNPPGKLYCVNESSSSQALVYNKNMFDAAGVAYPTDDWTWDDMVSAAEKLTKDNDGDGNTDQWGLVIYTSDYQPWIWAAGGSFFNEDYSGVLTTEPEVEETLQWLADLRFKYKVSPPEDVRNAFPDTSFMFQQNQAAMIVTGWLPAVAYFFPAITDFEWDVVMTPANPVTGQRAAGAGSTCNGVFASTENPEEAYQVWKWMVSDEGVYYRSAGNTGTPMMPGGPADQWPMLTAAFNEVKSPANAKAYLDMLPYTKLTLIPKQNQTEIFNTIDSIMDDLWLGNKTAAEIAPLLKQAVDPLLAQ